MKYERILEAIEKGLAKEFAVTIEDLRKHANISELTAAVKARDVDRAMAALDIDPAAYGPVQEELRKAFIIGGVGAVDEFPKPPEAPRMVIRFNVRNTRAETFLAQKSSELVQQIIDEQRDAIKVLLEAGLAHGDGAKRTALDIIGRIDKATGRREGGVIGMTKQQGKWLVNARDELESGNYDSFLNRALRDKRFDKKLIRLLAKEGRLTKSEIDNILLKYSNKILGFRGQMIARTEGIEALNSGRLEGLRQSMEKAGVSEREVKRTWDSSGDSRTREDHRIMDGQEVEGSDGIFRAPDGSRLRYPGDKSLGASAAQTILCRCFVKVEVDYFGRL
jgi:hypothetical protein